MRYAIVAALIALPLVAQAQTAPAYVLRQGNGTATVLDRAGIRRDGQMVSITSMLLFAEPVRDGDIDWFWNDAIDEFDCAANAWRTRADARATLERDRKQGLNDPDASEEWTPIDAGSLTAKEAALACKGETGGMTAVPDLKAFAAKFAGR
jgi:hypothetical protein